MKDKYKVLVVKPLVGIKARWIDRENELEQLQELVGGYIECVPFRNDVVAICNEEGKLMNLPPCVHIRGDVLCGTVVFAGVDGEEFTDIPEDFAI